MVAKFLQEDISGVVLSDFVGDANEIVASVIRMNIDDSSLTGKSSQS